MAFFRQASAFLAITGHIKVPEPGKQDRSQGEFPIDSACAIALHCVRISI
jgi:hypothetical protein